MAEATSELEKINIIVEFTYVLEILGMGLSYGELGVA